MTNLFCTFYERHRAPRHELFVVLEYRFYYLVASNVVVQSVDEEIQLLWFMNIVQDSAVRYNTVQYSTVQQVIIERSSIIHI